MSYTGVIIGETDTLKSMGLILLADLKIGVPTLKSNIIDIPGADGSVNMSYVISDGEPRYSNRDITFSLFKSTDELSFSETFSRLLSLCHGREQTLILPNDRTHYYKGLFSIGERSGYNSCTIPVSVSADPYAYKIELTTLEITIPESGKTDVYLYNEMRPVIPEFSATEAVTVSFGNSQYTLPAGTSHIPALKLKAGDNVITLEGNAGSKVTVSYREARL